MDSIARRLRARPWRTGWSMLALLLAIAAVAPFVLRPAPTVSADPMAPGFDLPLLSGGTGALSLHALRGRTVLLNFFQSDCGPCLDEMPVLARSARAFRKQGVVVVAVSSLGDTSSAARRLAQADHLPFPVVADSNEAVAWQYEVSATPTTVFIDARGRLRGQYSGELDARLVRDGLAQAGAIACSGCAPVEPPAFGAADTAVGNALRVTHVFTPPFTAAAPFALPDQRGRLITPASLRGKVVALTFLSAVCTQQCPLVGQTLSQARHLLGRDAAHLSIVAISVAPEQDSPRATRHFATKSGWIGTDWHYLTAPRKTLERVWNAYWVPVYAPPPIFKTTGAGLVHQAGLYLLDPRGRLRAYDDVPFLASDVASSVRALLAAASSS